MSHILFLKFRLIIIILISLFSLCAFSQENSNYSLLWKISGNSLDKPSFLFGTMHVKDKRVFNFSDSVMLSLKSCSRFALEVHPDTIMKKMFILMDNNDSLHSIDKLLDKDQYKKLAEKFQEKNGYPMNKANPVLLESLMEPEDDKPDDEVSFIDAYLYGIARTLNKNIFGLEDASSQIDQYYGSDEAVKERLMDLLDDDITDAKDESKEEMVKIYSTGDLNAIYKYALQTELLDSSIAARNKVMAASMIKYMAGSQLFTAIGVAHLPGPDGVISLLRNAGYNVTVVKSAFTGVAATYHIDYLKMDWPLYKEIDKGYSINFPGAPIKNKLYGRENIIYPDMANDVYYGLYYLQKGTADEPANQKEVIDKTIKLLTSSNNNKIISKKEFLINKIPYTELLLKQNSEYMRMRMVLVNNLLYLYYVGSKRNHLNNPLADKFLNSFAYFPIPQKNITPWITYTNEEGAFSVNLPVSPQVITKKFPSKIQTDSVTFLLNLYLSIDSINFRTYLIRYNDYPEGTFLSDKNAFFASLVNDFKGKGKIVGEPVKIWNDGFEGREVKVILNGGYNSVVRLFIRGNRVYILLKEFTQADLKDQDKNNPFFDSFHFIPYAQPDYYSYEPVEGNFKIKMPAKPIIKHDTLQNYTSYLETKELCFSTNPKSGALYDFEHSKISPYFRVENVDSLYKKLIGFFNNYPDSVIKVDTIVESGIKGREVISLKKGTDIKKRNRILIDGDNVFFLSGRMDNSELFDKTSEVFYNSLNITSPSPKEVLYSSKAQKICNDLGSSETLVYKKALGALFYYKFTPDELPYIFTALKKSYPDDSLKDGVRCKLIEKLKLVNNDSTICFLSALYKDIAGKDQIKGAILNSIPYINKKTGYDVYFKLLTTDPPLHVKEAYELFEPVDDSVEFATKHFDQLLPFIKYDNYRYYILRAAKNILNQKTDSCYKIVSGKYLNLMAFSQADINNYLRFKDTAYNDYQGLMYNYMFLAGKVKMKDFNDKLTNFYLEKDPKGLYSSDAAVARVYNNLPVNLELGNRVLDSLGTRYDLMEAYNEQKQLNKVPLKYRTQSEYAKLCMYQYISSDDYGSPTKITLLGNIIKNGYIYYVFKFLLPEKDEDEQLIGITGPYKVGSTKLNFQKYFSYTEYAAAKNKWRLQAEKMIKPLIEAYSNK